MLQLCQGLSHKFLVTGIVTGCVKGFPGRRTAGNLVCAEGLPEPLASSDEGASDPLVGRFE